MKFKTIAVCIALLMVTLNFLAEGTVSAQAEKINVVATTTQAADAVRIIAGDKVNLTGLMGAGVDPHLYKPTEADIRAMNEADLVIYSGLHLEGQFDKVFEALGERSIRTYPLSDPVKNAGYVIETLDAKGASAHDPHFWFDPRNWAMAVEGVAEVLAETDPANGDLYRANAKAYSADLDLLYQWSLEAMSGVPEDKRILITSHDAFQYFAAAFGWKVVAVQGISTAAEASVSDIQKVAKAIMDSGIPVIFVESSVPHRTIEAVIESARAQGGKVRTGIRDLYSDAMDAPDKYGGTYIGMFTHNVATIVRSFEVELPVYPETLAPKPAAELIAQ